MKTRRVIPPADWPDLVVLNEDRQMAKKLVRMLGRAKAYQVCQVVDQYVKQRNKPEFGGLLP